MKHRIIMRELTIQDCLDLYEEGWVAKINDGKIICFEKEEQDATKD